MDKAKISKTIKSYSMIIILVFIAVLFHFLTNGLIFTNTNITNIILQNSYVVILICGMLPVILTGNVDLSVGSLLAFVGAVASRLHVTFGWGVLPTLIVSLGVGVLIGCWNGFWIAHYDIPPFIVTLSGELVLRGLTQVVLGGASIGPFKDSFRKMATGFIPDLFHSEGFHMTTIVLAVAACGILFWNVIRERKQEIKNGIPAKSWAATIIPAAVISAVVLLISYALASNEGYPTVMLIMLGLCLLYSFVCKRTKFGRSLYAVGGNRKAAALSGINDRKTMFLAYANNGLMAAVAGIVYVARLNAATPKAGVNFELDAIAACYVGGASVSGGAGSIAGALVGCFVIAILNNGMSMMGVSQDWQQVVKGLVILGAVALDLVPKRKKK